MTSTYDCDEGGDCCQLHWLDMFAGCLPACCCNIGFDFVVLFGTLFRPPIVKNSLDIGTACSFRMLIGSEGKGKHMDEKHVLLLIIKYSRVNSGLWQLE